MHRGKGRRVYHAHTIEKCIKQWLWLAIYNAQSYTVQRAYTLHRQIDQQNNNNKKHTHTQSATKASTRTTAATTFLF